VDVVYWLICSVVVLGLVYSGVLRSTGLIGRTRADEEKERQQDASAKWLKKDAERNDNTP
jgi:hypothetical protein